jgi:hypothetical protein
MQLLRHSGQKAVTLGRIWSIINQLILLCTTVMVIPAIAAAQTTLSGGAWYTSNDISPFYKDSHWSIAWQDSFVYDYPPQAGALYWYAHIVYRNISNQKLTLNCPTSSNNLTPIREHMRGTANAGYVDAAETFCTRYPGWLTILSPGDAFNDWAIFHNVPWKAPGSEVSIEWPPYGFTPWVNPWANGPFFVLGTTTIQPECPLELVTLGTCKPPVIPTRQLGEDEEKVLENFALCETDLLHTLGLVATGVTLGPVVGGVVAGADIVSRITEKMAVGQGLLTVIAIKQDPKNLNNYVELILEFAPGASCAKIAQGIALGANKTIITPLIYSITH